MVTCQNGWFNRIVSNFSKISSNHWHWSIPTKSKAIQNQMDENIFYNFLYSTYIDNGCIFSDWCKIHIRIWVYILWINLYAKCNCQLFHIHLAIRRYIEFHRKLRGIHWKKWVETSIVFIIWIQMKIASYLQEFNQHPHTKNWFAKLSYIINSYTLPCVLRLQYFFSRLHRAALWDITCSIWEPIHFFCLVPLGSLLL